MASRTFASNKSSLFADGSSNLGGGADDHMPVGGPYSGYTFRSAVRFALDFSTMKRIDSAVLRLKTSDQVHVAFSSDPDIYIARATADWSANSSSGSSDGGSGWGTSPTVYPGPASTSTNRVSKDISTSQNATVDIDITGIVRDWFGGAANYGVLLYYVASGDVTEFYSYRHGTSGNRPSIIVTYATDTPPTASMTAPTGVQGARPTLSGSATDPDGDAIESIHLEVLNASSAVVYATDLYGVATFDHVPTSDLPGGALTARCVAQAAGVTGAWSNSVSFTVDRPPVVGAFSSPPASGSNRRPPITFAYTDPEANVADYWDLEIYATSSPGVATGSPIYATSSPGTFPSPVSHTPTVDLPGGNLVVRARVRSGPGFLWSAWSADYPFLVALNSPTIVWMWPAVPGGYVPPKADQFADINPGNGNAVWTGDKECLWDGTAAGYPEAYTTPPPGWRVVSGGGTMGTSAGHGGGVVGNAGGVAFNVRSAVAASDGMIMLNRVQGGRTYTFSAYHLREPWGGTSAQCWLGYFDRVGTYIGASVQLDWPVTQTAGVWEQRTATIVIPNNVAHLSIALGSGSGSDWFDGISVYGPAPSIFAEARVNVLPPSGQTITRMRVWVGPGNADPSGGVVAYDAAWLAAGGEYAMHYYAGASGTWSVAFEATASGGGVTKVWRACRIALSDWTGRLFLGDNVTALATALTDVGEDTLAWYRAEDAAGTGLSAWSLGDSEPARIAMPATNAWLGLRARAAYRLEDVQLLSDTSFEERPSSLCWAAGDGGSWYAEGAGSNPDGSLSRAVLSCGVNGASYPSLYGQPFARVRIVPGAYYRLSGWQMNVGTKRTRSSRIEWFDGDAAPTGFVGHNEIVHSDLADGVWRYFSGQWVAPSNARWAHVRLFIYEANVPNPPDHYACWDLVSWIGPPGGPDTAFPPSPAVGGLDRWKIDWTSAG